MTKLVKANRDVLQRLAKGGCIHAPRAPLTGTPRYLDGDGWPRLDVHSATLDQLCSVGYITRDGADLYGDVYTITTKGRKALTRS